MKLYRLELSIFGWIAYTFLTLSPAQALEVHSCVAVSVKNQSPVPASIESDGTFRAPSDQIWVFTSIDEWKQGDRISHLWHRHTVKTDYVKKAVDIGKRFYSNKRLSKNTLGTWTVDVHDQDGNIIDSVGLEIFLRDGAFWIKPDQISRTDCSHRRPSSISDRPLTQSEIVNDRKNPTSLEVQNETENQTPPETGTTVPNQEIANLGFNDEAFYFRKQWGVWAQGALGYASQTIAGQGNTTASMGAQSSGVYRVGAGAWYDRLIAEVYFRDKLVTLTNQGFSPHWLDAYVGYRFELPRFLGLTPYIVALAGIEQYGNTVTVPDVRYLMNYLGFFGGAQIRFVVGSKVEFGLDGIYGGASGVVKTLITGDLRYWVQKRDAVGLGFWTDISNEAAVDFHETSQAVELYWRHVFSW